MKENDFSRKELYDLVWSQPISKLAKMFNIEPHPPRDELEQRKELKFIVSGSIYINHPMVKSSRKLLENIDDSKEKFKFWQVSQEKYILPIHTDKTLRTKALRFMDTLIRIVEAMGHKITFVYSRCHVEMFGQMTEINLRQKVYSIRDNDERG
jgi:hypothetical protein